jgi:hypothetical protein
MERVHGSANAIVAKLRRQFSASICVPDIRKVADVSVAVALVNGPISLVNDLEDSRLSVATELGNLNIRRGSADAIAARLWRRSQPAISALGTLKVVDVFNQISSVFLQQRSLPSMADAVEMAARPQSGDVGGGCGVDAVIRKTSALYITVAGASRSANVGSNRSKPSLRIWESGLDPATVWAVLT